jgi:hypothetical protein
MKNYMKFLFILLLVPLFTFAQDDEPKKEKKVKEKLERRAFESSFLIDNPTNVLFSKNTLEVNMAHRFGLITGGDNDLAGIWAPSNIQIGASYAIHERLTVGVSTTKFDRLQSLIWKVALLRQTRSNKMPVSVSYYGNWTVDARKKENFNLVQDRYSFYHQLIIARRFSQMFSFQIAPSISHYNLVSKEMDNDMIAISAGGRMKISDQTAIMIDYTQPVTRFSSMNPKPGLSVGVEFATSAHAFQLLIGNYNGIVPQKNIMFNQNDYFKGDVLIGFNITRLYNF